MLDDTLTAPGEDVEPTTPADVYAVGALCVELTLGAPPAPANVAQGRAEAIARHPELAQVLQGCLAEGITERLRLGAPFCASVWGAGPFPLTRAAFPAPQTTS